MSHPEDIKKKIPINALYKNIPSTTTVIAGKETLKHHLSNEKQLKENKEKNKIKIREPYHQQLEQRQGSANVINFKNIKAGVTKIQGKTRLVSPKQHQGISINVNIQNMFERRKNDKIDNTYKQKKQYEQFKNKQPKPNEKTDRSGGESARGEIKRDKSKSLIKKMQEENKNKNKPGYLKHKKDREKPSSTQVSVINDDFHCSQEIQYDQKNKLHQKEKRTTTQQSMLQTVDKKAQLNTSAYSTITHFNQSAIGYSHLDSKFQDTQTLSTLTHKTRPLGKPNPNEILIQLKKFEEQQELINMEAQSQALSYITQRQIDYSVQSTYIERRQKHMTWIMRAILVDWMMHVNFQFSLKRETFHTAVIITDKFFSLSPNISKSQFQLVGATSMFIAAKLQQLQPLPSMDFAHSTNDRYSEDQIKAMETKICMVLKFQINPPTIFTWANRIMAQWDQYIEISQTGKSHTYFSINKRIFFKKADEQSYKNFRQLVQLLDFAMLDVQSYQHRMQFLVCSFMYLVLGKQLNEFKVHRITSEFPRSSLYLLDENSYFNNLFHSFVEQSFGFTLIDLLPAVQYSATFFILPIIIGPALRNEQQLSNINDLTLEDYCTFQTYNVKMLQKIRERFRGIYD